MAHGNCALKSLLENLSEKDKQRFSICNTFLTKKTFSVTTGDPRKTG